MNKNFFQRSRLKRAQEEEEEEAAAAGTAAAAAEALPDRYVTACKCRRMGRVSSIKIECGVAVIKPGQHQGGASSCIDGDIL